MTQTSKILWPRPAVADCLFGAIVRDTRGVALDETQRFNFFPASPLCCVSCVLTGDAHLVDGPDRIERPWTGEKLPALAFCGAQLGPLVTWNPGEVHGITLMFYPDAVSLLTGLDLGPFAGRFVPAQEVLPRPFCLPCRDFFYAAESGGVDGAYAIFEGRIEAMWAERRPAGAKPMERLKDWARALARRAALTEPGHSARQIARRVKSWTGVSRRDLQVLGHTEQLYARLHTALESGEIDWAGLAAASGFADQAHMIRQMRRHTGFTPERLRQNAANEEAFWCYRLLRQYFSTPKRR